MIGQTTNGATDLSLGQIEFGQRGATIGRANENADSRGAIEGEIPLIDRRLQHGDEQRALNTKRDDKCIEQQKETPTIPECRAAVFLEEVRRSEMVRRRNNAQGSDWDSLASTSESVARCYVDEMNRAIRFFCWLTFV